METPINKLPIVYSFEKQPRPDPKDSYLAIALGTMTGMYGGLFGMSQLDEAANDYNYKITNAKASVQSNMPQSVRQLKTLETHKVASPSVGIDGLVLGGSMFSGAALVPCAYLAARSLAFKLKMKKNRAIVKEACNILELDQAVRQPN